MSRILWPMPVTDKYRTSPHACQNEGEGYRCDRLPGHTGRHAAWDYTGKGRRVFVEVWGQDVHAEKRAKGRTS